MSEIVDLAQVRNAKERPDPQFVRQDEYGRPLYTFSYSFEHEGKRYGFHFLAYSFDDAQAKLDSIRSTAVLDGQVYAEVPQ